MDDCIFCKIVNKEIPANIAYEDDEILVFHDLEPQAPVHVLVIPKRHIASIDSIEATDEDRQLIGSLFAKLPGIASSLGLSTGYRVVSNCGADALQTVFHLHFHLLGGRKFGWPPG